MPSDYMVTRARDLTEALAAILPQIQFQAYVAQGATQEVCDLYLFGFITNEVLVGGYCITDAQVGLDFNTHVLSMSQFFRRAWAGETPRFHPAEVQARYEEHREGGRLWQRVV